MLRRVRVVLNETMNFNGEELVPGEFLSGDLDDFDVQCETVQMSPNGFVHFFRPSDDYPDGTRGMLMLRSDMVKYLVDRGDFKSFNMGKSS